MVFDIVHSIDGRSNKVLNKDSKRYPV
jgi:hypothetical protein